MPEKNDAGKVVTREGIGGPVVKQALAGAPQYKWKVLKREHGVWTEIASKDTEAEALELASKLKAEKELELMVVNAA